jgi:hypothetical protein
VFFQLTVLILLKKEELNWQVKEKEARKKMSTSWNWVDCWSDAKAMLSEFSILAVTWKHEFHLSTSAISVQLFKLHQLADMEERGLTLVGQSGKVWASILGEEVGTLKTQHEKEKKKRKYT